MSSLEFSTSNGLFAPIEHGDADPKTCKHDWWEDRGIVYTSYPPRYRQVCKNCGAQQFVTHNHDAHVPARWVKA